MPCRGTHAPRECEVCLGCGGIAITCGEASGIGGMWALTSQGPKIRSTRAPCSSRARKAVQSMLL